MAESELFTQRHWDERYRARERVFSGRPNPQLVDRASGVTPGAALDVGCGEGADAIWLARRGWTVTGVDVSPVGLARAATFAEQAGPRIAARIRWQQADLFAPDGEPFGAYDLVTSHFLHLLPQVRARALDRLAASVAPGGLLLEVAHHPSDLEIPGLRPNLPELFCTAAELAGQLEPGRWEVLEESAPERVITGPDGEPVTIRDAVLLARRLP